METIDLNCLASVIGGTGFDWDRLNKATMETSKKWGANGRYYGSTLGTIGWGFGAFGGDFLGMVKGAGTDAIQQWRGQ